MRQQPIDRRPEREPELNRILEFLKTQKPGTDPIPYKPGETITDFYKFLDSHEARAKAVINNDRLWIPVIARLQEAEKYFKKNEK